ncbi:TIGR03986 family CRISPR-associated RAMP protein [Campylobacter sp. MOP7]|uniref:TIGR03986 family type III CRISPR-associated RAMP protein n=1 Tax=Campylobacter canis TaxID=3378588 RepID=UPI00387E3B78
MITAPYNFVPLNDKVFYPSWADKISHDIPFEDGESGVIELEITAQSPIFIRNHYAVGDTFYEVKTDGGIKKYSTEFCHIKSKTGGKEFYIPATTIKGAIRNVLEIMSFSRIRIDEEKHKKYLSVRDMTNRDLLAGIASGCGFLIKKGNDYILADCGKVVTINLQKEKEYKNIKEYQYGKDKYEKFGFLKEIKFSQHYNQKKKFIIRGSLGGDKEGFLVFTGDIQNKKHEFVFCENGKKITLDKNVFENFEKVYFKNKNAIDGQYLKDKFEKGNKIPIFYKQEKNGGKITHIGLTQIFKIAYNKTIFEAARQNNTKENGVDLSEAIFGFVKKDKALKGRVYFSHFKANLTTYEYKENEYVEGILGTPNESYYPNYLEQYGAQGVTPRYKTLMDQDARIRGYKRYPLHKEPLALSKGNDKNQDVKTKFKPLQKGVTFKGKVVFHNLKKAEIGALLSAITFCGEKDKMHNIGLAKPYGYGKISISVNSIGLNFSQNNYIKEFEQEMDKFHSNWKNSPQIQELLTMASSTKCKSDSDLKYQILDPDNKKNDFSEDKKEKCYLMQYSKYTPALKDKNSCSNQNKVYQAKTNSTQQICKASKKEPENTGFSNRIDISSFKESKK